MINKLKDLNDKNKKERNPDGMFKYVIAASVIGMCIGNMFVARRFKGILKMKVDTYKASNNTNNNTTNNSNNNSNSTNNNQYYSHYKSRSEWEKAEAEADVRFRQRFKDYEYQQQQFNQTRESYEKRFRTVLPDNLKRAFVTLNLTPKVHSPTEIKEAYRAVALKCHPDRIPKEIDDPKRAELTVKFKDATVAYKLLLDNFK